MAKVKEVDANLAVTMVTGSVGGEVRGEEPGVPGAVSMEGKLAAGGLFGGGLGCPGPN